ncbi:MAG: SusC/RagA family TonB-linked outer membrane protein, partial [Bacteroidales bacterium]|nr:SusC/RagA family TonB-linked outer membrane protein [Bacteroidales bacterium]
MCFFLTIAGIIPAKASELTSPIPKVVQQQSITISGVVKDQNGEAVIGASILEKGTTNGTITDIDGQYTLKVTNSNSILAISYIGYKTEEVRVGSNRKIDVILNEDAGILDEVVVIGYGTQRKGDVTSAIASVKAEDFTVGKIGDAAELIKGKVAGLSITKASGNPNESSSIMLRGITTLTGNVSPLVLVDGIEGSLTTVAPENIASIDVLKDASAAAIYGTRGANGVILITTKTGKRESHVNTSYSGYLSFSNWLKKSKFMDTRDVINGLTPFEYEGYDTDWLKAITRKSGYVQNHSLSIDGGSKNSTYSANVTYSDEEGIMRKSDNRNIRIQLDFNQYVLNDMLKFNLNALIGRQTHTLNENAYAYRQAIIHNPSSPLYNEDGSYYENLNLLYYYNPRSMQDEHIGDARNRYYRMTGNITFEPIKGWQTNLMLSMKENMYKDQNFRTSKHYSLLLRDDYNGSASKSENSTRSDNIELTSKYDFTIKKNRFSALVGYSYLYNVYDGFNAGNGNFPTEAYLYNNLGQGSLLTEKDRHAWMGSSKNDNTLVGFFGRVSYGYDDRYNALISVRHEGSSKFGENHKWGTFPSISLGWTISNERFMEKQEWLNNLKLRVGYGVTGVIPSSSYLSQYEYNYAPYGDILNKEGDWIKTLEITRNPNKELKWETTKEWNFGLDWMVLNGRLGGSIDYYIKTTSDLLYDYSVPVPPNLHGVTKANVGKMRNSGVEVMINAIPLQFKEFEWSTTFTMSHNKNKLI